MTVRTGRLIELWRYPVKSMGGERLAAAPVGTMGIAGDRGFAVIDRETGKVATGKRPSLWALLLHCRARYVVEPLPPHDPGVAEVVLPDGVVVRSDDPHVNEAISRRLGRPVVLAATPPSQVRIELAWSDEPGAAPEDFIAETSIASAVPAERLSEFAVGALKGGQSFFDVAPIHLLTTASIRRAAALAGAEAPVERLRPNMVVELDPDPAADGDGFPENDWLDRRLGFGAVELIVTRITARCIMVANAQPGLPQDSSLLRALVGRNLRALPFGARTRTLPCLGAYAEVTEAGRLEVGMSGQLAAPGAVMEPT